MVDIKACLGEAGVAELVHESIQPCGQQRLGAHRRKHLAQRRLAVAGQRRALLPGEAGVKVWQVQLCLPLHSSSQHWQRAGSHGI